MHNHVRHFRRRGNRDLEPLQVVGVQMEKLVFGITNVEDCPASHKTRAEFFGDCFDERVLSAGRNGYGFAGRKFHRDAGEFPTAFQFLADAVAGDQIRFQLCAPFQRVECSDQFQRVSFNLIDGLAAVGGVIITASEPGKSVGCNR